MSEAQEFTVGVEEEYQLVDSRTGGLVSGAREVLGTDWSEEITREIQRTQLEVGTAVSGTAVELDRELRRLRFQVDSAAAAHDLRIVAAAVHPFSRWEAHRQTEEERYERLHARFGRVKRSEHVFGMHVHVGIPAELDRIRILNVVRWYTPHLLALSASSPLYEGEDSGYASYRAIVARRLPFTGPPPRFADAAEHRAFVDRLVRSGATEDPWTLYWSVRPHPEYPTVEFRVCDVCPRVEDAVAIAALVRALVIAAADGRLEEPPRSLSESAADAVLRGNEWLAARYGLRARLAAPDAAAGEVLACEAVTELLARVHPIAAGTGDAEALAGIATILARGNGAQRIREVLPRCEDLPALVEWLARESVLGTGLDRRGEQRNACG